MALGLALRKIQNIHPCTSVQGVVWYGVNQTEAKLEGIPYYALKRRLEKNEISSQGALRRDHNESPK